MSLEIPEALFAVLVGPSGCGKSTLLRLLAGLEQADTGAIRFGGRDVTRLEPRERDIAMVFQSYALYPHLTVRDNLAFGLKLRKADAGRDRAARRGGLGDARPRPAPRSAAAHALGRASGSASRWAAPSSAGPSSSSSTSRSRTWTPRCAPQVRVDIRKLHDRLGATSVYVTHDQVEAMTLADVLFVLDKGKVEQAGAPLDIYGRPATRFVAGFMGSPAMNFFQGVLEEEGGRFRRERRGALRSRGRGALRTGALRPGRVVTVGVRAHDVRLAAEGEGAAMQVSIVEALGVESFAHGELGGAPFVARVDADALVRRGDRIHVAFSTMHLFDAGSGASLRAP